MPNNDDRLCSNCNKSARLSSAMVTQQGGRIVSVICDRCQKAKKIRLVFEKGRKGWQFNQYYPVEA